MGISFSSQISSFWRKSRFLLHSTYSHRGNAFALSQLPKMSGLYPPFVRDGAEVEKEWEVEGWFLYEADLGPVRERASVSQLGRLFFRKRGSPRALSNQLVALKKEDRHFSGAMTRFPLWRKFRIEARTPWRRRDSKRKINVVNELRT